jgi:hypothetical protein
VSDFRTVRKELGKRFFAYRTTYSVTAVKRWCKNAKDVAQPNQERPR